MAICPEKCINFIKFSGEIAILATWVKNSLAAGGDGESAEGAGPAPFLTVSRALSESGPLRAVHLSRQKWPGGLVN